MTNQRADRWYWSLALVLSLAVNPSVAAACSEPNETQGPFLCAGQLYFVTSVTGVPGASAALSTAIDQWTVLFEGQTSGTLVRTPDYYTEFSWLQSFDGTCGTNEDALGCYTPKDTGTSESGRNCVKSGNVSVVTEVALGAITGSVPILVEI